MKINIVNLSLIASALAVVSCASDDDSEFEAVGATYDIPDTYEFYDASGVSTVSYSGQTARLEMGEEILDLFKTFGTTEETLDEMFADGTGFTDTLLDESGKIIRSKVAASDDYFSTNTSGAALIRSTFDGYITSQVTEFLGAFSSSDEVTEAEEGVAGYVTESGGTVRYINAQGYEYDQLFNKGLIGALTLDQVVNNYLTRCLNSAYQEDNTNGVLVEGKSYTTLEHYWDEAYGYVYGNIDNDSFLYKYIGRVEGDEDFTGIEAAIETAFITGRVAIVANEYDDVATQVEILQELLSEVIGIRAVYYLEQGVNNLGVAANFGDACHDLSEGYGFIYSLQFTRNPETGEPYVSADTVDTYIETLESGNGLWDLADNTSVLSTMADEIAAEFDFTVAQAGE